MAAADAIVIASARRYCMRYLNRAQWIERHFARLIYNPTSSGLHVRETPLISIESITLTIDENDPRVLVLNTDYRIDMIRGAIVFMELWPGVVQDLVIEYTAGWEPLPDDLQAVIDAAAQAQSLMTGALPAGVQSVDIPDVGSVRFGDTSSNKSALVPALQPYESVLGAYRDTSRFFGEASVRELSRVVTP